MLVCTLNFLILKQLSFFGGLFQPVWFPLCHSLYICIISGFQTQVKWLIKSAHVLLNVSSSCSLFTFSSYQSQGRGESLCVYEHRHVVSVFATIPYNWSCYQSLISQEGLTGLHRQLREDLISLNFPDYFPIGNIGLKMKQSHGHRCYT